ncbi:MAG: serine/threonine protein kinase [Chloroflexota bacterium]
MDTANPLLASQSTDEAPLTFLKSVSEIFIRFGEDTQDSGNISYGVTYNEKRYFVKSAGRVDDEKTYFDHGQRVDMLRNAVRLNQGVAHPALPKLYNVIESPEGPLLVYEWCSGELVRCPNHIREQPNSSFQRFRRLPLTEIRNCLDVIYQLHKQLAKMGWIACDFYDGAMLYDFDRRVLRIIDLDHYHQGPFVNEMGRMFGSSRFMAPEEFEKGALIDERTTVFTLGRTAAVLLSDGSLERTPFRGTDRLYEVVVQACEPNRNERFGSVADFYHAWKNADQGEIS